MAVNLMFTKGARLMAWRPKSPLCTEQSTLQAEAVQVPCILPVTLSKLDMDNCFLKVIAYIKIDWSRKLGKMVYMTNNMILNMNQTALRRTDI